MLYFHTPCPSPSPQYFEVDFFCVIEKEKGNISIWFGLDIKYRLHINYSK